jgi:hypothetical protein
MSTVQNRRARLEKKNVKLTNEPTQVSPTSIADTPDSPAAPTDTSSSTQGNANITQEKVLSKEQIIAKAAAMWKDLKAYVEKNAAFKKYSDKEKLEFFRKKLNYDIFMTEYPIVSRYMICLGQYSAKAFGRFLDKVRNNIVPAGSEKGKAEDEWVRRQADYVQYLWEAYQKSHINTAARAAVWEDAYKSLKGEFNDFRTMHEKIEERVVSERKELNGRNAKELINRIVTSDQSVDSEDEEAILYHLQVALVKKNYSAVHKQLLDLSDTVYAKRIASHVILNSIGSGSMRQGSMTMIERDYDMLPEVPEVSEVPEEDISST